MTDPSDRPLSDKVAADLAFILFGRDATREHRIEISRAIDGVCNDLGAEIMAMRDVHTDNVRTINRLIEERETMRRVSKEDAEHRALRAEEVVEVLKKADRALLHVKANLDQKPFERPTLLNSFDVRNVDEALVCIRAVLGGESHDK